MYKGLKYIMNFNEDCTVAKNNVSEYPTCFIPEVQHVSPIESCMSTLPIRYALGPDTPE